MRYQFKEFFFFCICCMLINNCSREKTPDEEILVRIKDKTITVNEFIHRSELTPRPFYCRGSSERDKKIILNSLIVEKLIALDHTEHTDLENEETLQIYLKGIREQAMRMLLYKEKILNKIEIDSADIIKNYRMAGIEYVLKYYTIYDSALVQLFLSNRADFEQIFRDRMGKVPIPRKKIQWQDQEDASLHNMLFTTLVSPGSVIGPFKTQDEGYLVLKVDSVRDSRVISQQDIQERRRLVIDRLKQNKAAGAWLTYINNLMENRKITFYLETLKTVGKLFEDIYFSSESSQIESIDITDRFAVFNNNINLMISPFYRTGDRIWTVRDFKQLIIAHPLVYRTSELSKENYKFYFQKAIVDLMGDFFLTQEAYKLGMDDDYQTVRTVEMWKDALLTKRYVNAYLNEIKKRKNFDPDRMKGDSPYLDDYSSRLILQYSDQIQINLPAFLNIRITGSPMMVIQSLQPHALAVPPFPQLTLENSIDMYQPAK